MVTRYSIVGGVMNKIFKRLLLVSTILSGNAFATGTYYVGTAENNYIINLGGTDADSMLSYEDKVKVNNASGTDSVTIRYAIFEDLYDDKPTTTHAYPDYGAERGGAFSSLGPINEITSSIFKNNVAKPESGFAYGGAIHVQQATVGLISDSVFDGNQAISEAQSRAWGGAIHSNRSNFEGIVNSTFTNNLVQTNSPDANNVGGGAIGFNGGALKKIENSKFTGNKAITTESTLVFGGAIFMYSAGMGDVLNTSFSDNYIEANGTAYGGAIAFTPDVYGTYDDKYDAVRLYADFTNNHVKSLGSANGGAIYLESLYYNPDIQGTFTGNYTEGKYAYGGAIYNRGQATIKNITGDFIGNYALSSKSSYGGAIYNGYSSTIGNINGNFTANSVCVYDLSSPTSNMKANGVIYNDGSISSITGDFIDNYAEATASGSSNVSIDVLADGVAIYNNILATINSITGDFIRNHAKSSASDTSDSSINVSATAGAISNRIFGTIDSITGDFIDNYAEASVTGSATNSTISVEAMGGAIYNYTRGTISSITGDFIGNYAKASIPSSSDATYTSSAKGGAIYSSGDITLASGAEQHIFDGNYTEDSRGKIYNAIYSSGVVTFATSGVGSWVVNDNIEGGTYNFIGDDTIDTELGITTQYININNAIIGSGEVNLENTTLRFGTYQHKDTSAKNWDAKGKFIASLNEDGTENLDAESVTSLSLNNAVFDIANGYLETVNLKNYTSTDSFVHLDVDVEKMTSDIIHVKGDVDGVTKLVVHSSSNKDIRGQGKILFAASLGDTKGGETSFEVSRVYKSPYLYDVIYEGFENPTPGTDTGEGSSGDSTTGPVSKDNSWYLAMNDKENPNKEETPDVPTMDIPIQQLGPIKVAPEVVATAAVKAAGLAQTNGMIYNIMRKVGVNHLYCPGCGFYDYNWNGATLHNAWVDTTYNGLTIDAPVEIKAKVWGIEAGSDIQQNLHNKLGIFASYRQGNYEMDGTGDKYYSTIGSEIDVDSYLSGLYYRYDKNNWYAFATVYGGIQEAEVSTADGVANYDTKGIEFGGSIESGYSHALSKTVYVTPSLGVFYSQISYDDATDNVGKTVKYNDLQQVEIEAGLKLSKAEYLEDGFYAIYLKPSIVQTLVDGDEVDVTELGKVTTVEDKALGRVEIGANYGFTENWSAYGWANYTFGSDYEATSLGLGVNYSW